MALGIVTQAKGTVWVGRLTGSVVLGEEVQALEKAAGMAAHSSSRWVLEMSGVTRVDSSGIGLLVRLLTQARKRGGDLRLAGLTEGMAGLLRMTTLDRLFLSYGTEGDAVASFAGHAVPAREATAAGAPRVLFVDPERDLGVFVRTVLELKGYEVLVATTSADARVLLAVNGVGAVLMRPDATALGLAERTEALKGKARGARMLALPKGFGGMDAEMAGRVLLETVRR